jgi:ribosome-binding factor A
VARKRNPRTDRQVRAALAELLDSEVADPRLTLVSITEVDVTPDHEVATVYYSTLDPSLVARDPRRTGGDRLPAAHEVEEGLRAATPRLRSLLAQRVRLRVTPELRFRPDPVVEQAARVESLLRDLGTDRPEVGTDAAGDAPPDEPADASPGDGPTDEPTGDGPTDDGAR